MMEVAISLSTRSTDLGAAARLAAAADGSALAGLVFGELTFDTFSVCSMLGAHTRRIGVASGVAGIWRSPVLTAVAAATVDEITGGRFTLGLGTGVPGLAERWHATDASPPLPRLREFVAVVRGALAAWPEPFSYSGDFYRVEGYQRSKPPLRPDIPIFLAAARPGMAGLAGEVADGAYLGRIHTPRYLREVLIPPLQAAGREVERWVHVRCFPGEGPEVRQALERNLGLDGTYGEKIRATTGESVEETLQGCTISGSPSACRAAVARYEGLVDRVVLAAPDGLEPQRLERVYRDMLEIFG